MDRLWKIVNNMYRIVSESSVEFPALTSTDPYTLQIDFSTNWWWTDVGFQCTITDWGGKY